MRGMGDPQSRGAGGGNVYFGSGILKSTDSGQSWTLVNNATFPPSARIAKVVVDPTNADRVYAVVRAIRTGNDSAFGGFYFSTDGGINWTRTFETTGLDLALSSTDFRTLYMGGGRGLYRSIDGGLRWARLFETGPGQTYVAIAPNDPRTIYASLKDNATGLRMLVSNDGGVTWSPRPTPPAELFAKAGWPQYIAVDPTDARTVYVGGEDLWKSVDGAESWTNLSRRVGMNNAAGPALHVDQCAIAFSPTDPGVVYFATDGGLYQSVDAGRSFQPLTGSLPIVQLYSIAVHPADKSLVFGGTQDNGVQRMLPNTTEWEILSRGDVGPVVIDTVDSNYVYTAGNFGFGIRRFRDRGQTFDRLISSSIPDRVTLMPALAASTTGNLYFGTWRLWISTNRGDTWTPGTTDLTKGQMAGDAIKVITVSKADPSVMYTGSHQGRVMVSRNAGVAWTDVTGTLPNRAITSIVTDERNAGTSYLTVSGFGSGHIFETVDSGARWTDISGNLPDIPTSALLVDPDDPNTLYAGTDIGVFRSTSGGNTWSAFNGGLPPGVIVTAFAAQPGGPILLATYGRGAYELKSAELNTGIQLPIRPPR